MTITPAELSERLRPWYLAEGRKSLPWQQDATPYRVWVSEVMLQQTQVETVKPYFERFVARFPDIPALAAAAPDEVLSLWSGLGYYARARNLHRAARDIVARHGGQMPDSFDAVASLPGIGRSTAGAILAFAHGQRHPILDGNARRVLARVFAVEDPPDTAAGAARLWALALACTPQEHVAEYTQAIMDLGATVCLRTRPACNRCPLSDDCEARITNRTATLPTARARRPRRLRHLLMVFAFSQGRVLLVRRPPRGIWGGLWTPPEFVDEASAQRWILAQFGLQEAPPARLPVLRHVVTHFDLDIEPWIVAVRGEKRSKAGEDARWHELDALNEVGLPAPVARLIEEYLHGPDRKLRSARPRSGRARPAAVSG